MKRLLIASGVVALGVAVAASAGFARTGGATAAADLPSSSCGPVFYKGSGSPQYLIASDLPLQGAGRAQPLSMIKAIQYVLEVEYKFKAGNFTVGYQSCDDATASTGGWDAAKCTANGRAYANEKKLLGILGTFNTGCAKLIIPIVNRAPGGSIAMISAANTGVGLTHTAAWTDPGEPKIYYPTGKRNYARVATGDDFQGPAGADLLKGLKKKKVYILHDNQSFGKGVANAFRVRAKKLGIQVLGFEAWDAKATSYEAIGERIKSQGADSVYLGGIVCNNGVKLLKDIGAVLGKGVTLVGPDGWTPFSATAGAGAAAQGMYISVAGLPLERLGPTGKKFIAEFRKYQKKAQVDPYAVYAAQTAQILLGAIAKSNGSRSQVVDNVFKTKVVDGIMGTFSFNKNGDITAPAISFYQLKGKNGVFKFFVGGSKGA
jgi:branched-chain amino acid transport system substrate-binding protein